MIGLVQPVEPGQGLDRDAGLAGHAGDGVVAADLHRLGAIGLDVADHHGVAARPAAFMARGLVFLAGDAGFFAARAEAAAMMRADDLFAT